MFLIKKGKEPNKLATHRNDGGTYYDFSLDKGKREVKDQLLKEQNNLCAYCTASINFDNIKVEHWLPQNNEDYPQYKQYELQYWNMLAVCKGCYNSGEYFHCDTSKRETIVEINPQEKSHTSQLSYTKSTGVLKSSSLTHQKEIDAILNLNISPLLKVRKDMLNAAKARLFKKYGKKTANFNEQLTKFSKKKLPYSAIIIWYLKSKLN